MDIEEVKALYGEFIGFLSQAPLPPPDRPEASLSDEAIWNQYNVSINKLTDLTGKDYSSYLIQPIKGHSTDFIRITTYRLKLGGLISRLHAEYFSDLPEPFSGKPSIVVNQSQQQSQSVLVQTVLQIRDKIDEQLPKHEEGTKEKGFLKKLKESLGTVSDVAQLFRMILKLAAEFGVTPDLLATLI